MTDYVILRSVNDGGWIEEKNVTARSARAAIRAVAESNGRTPPSPDVRFVAVPARSWQPVTVTVETRTQLKFQ